PAITAACQDPEIARFISDIPSPYTEADAHAFVTACKQLDPTVGRDLAIVEPGSGGLLGSIGVRLGEVGSIGYWVAPEARRRGIATRALILLSRWAVTEGGVQRLELT